MGEGLKKRNDGHDRLSVSAATQKCASDSETAGAETFVKSCGMSSARICTDLDGTAGSMVVRTMATLIIGRILAGAVVSRALHIARSNGGLGGRLGPLSSLLVQRLLPDILAVLLGPQLSQLTRMPCPRLSLSTVAGAGAVARLTGGAAGTAIERTAKVLLGTAAGPVLARTAAPALGAVSGGVVTATCYSTLCFQNDVAADIVSLLVDWTCPIDSLLAKVERDAPDAIICQWNCVDVGLALSRKHGIPLLIASLGADQLTGDLSSPGHYKRALAREELLLSRSLGGAGQIRAMGYEAWRRLFTEGVMYGLPSALAGDPGLRERFALSFGPETGERILRQLQRSVLTGFWALGQAEEQTAPEMFGGPETRARLEAFIAGGQRPVYIGWGSMGSNIMRNLPEHMCRLAVGALMRAGRRGVVLGGWAKLSTDMLAGGGDSEARKLRDYAEANVLFVEKAPHSWLFPQCSCAVIHGGIGTLGACWRAGIPTIVCPVDFDQPFNAHMNAALGIGTVAPRVTECTPLVLGDLIRKTLDTPEHAVRATMMSRLMSQDHGALQAALHIERVLDGGTRSRL